MKRLAHWFGKAALLALTLVLTEGILRVVSTQVGAVNRLLNPAWLGSPSLPDTALGTRGSPSWFDHDAWGFRNPGVPDSVGVVLLGDSQTYGVGVVRGDAWPARLAQLSGQRIYSMAFPGWGPVQGYLLLGQALSLRPKLVMYAFYFGNDLFDVFDMVTRRPALDDLAPKPLRDSAATLEARAPLAARIHLLFAQGWPVQADVGTRATASPLRQYLSRHSRLYGLLRALRGTARRNPTPAPLPETLERTLAGMSAQQRRLIAVHDASWKTVLTAPYRNSVMDDRDVRIRAGLEGSMRLLARMDTVCRRAGIRFVVVLIPTKETVFAPRIPDVDADRSLDSLVRNERRVREELVTWLTGRDIAYLDVRLALEAAGGQPYFENADGHPNPVGHRVIAAAVAHWMDGPH